MTTISKPLALGIQVLLILGALSGLPTGAGAGEGNAGGRAVNLIHDVYELQNMSLDLNASYALANDIDASETIDWNGGAGFAPVGNPWPVGDEVTPFNGSFDGRGHAITGLYLSHHHKYIGLFGRGTESSTISNLTLKNLYVSGSNTVGGLIGETYGNLSNCHVNGSVIAYNYIGGMVALLHNGTMDNCTFDGWLMEYNSESGGLVGINDGGTIANCSSTGSSHTSQTGGGLVGENMGVVTDCHSNWTIEGGSATGGLVGQNSGQVSRCFSIGSVYVQAIGDAGGLIAGNKGTVSNCYYSGIVKNDLGEAGGIAATNVMGTISDCFSMGKVNSGKSDAGGLVGHNLGSLTDCYSVANVSSPGNAGGLVADGNNFVTGCYWDREASGINKSSGGTALNTSDMMKQDSFKDWNFTDIWDISEGLSYPFLRAFNATIPGINHPPTINTPAVTSVMEDSLYSVQYNATDMDHDSLQWSLITDAGWLYINSSTGLLSGIPTRSDTGAHDVQVIVTDAKGGFDSRQFWLTVTPLPGEPSWIDAPGDASLLEGENYSFDALARDFHANTTISYSLNASGAGLPAGMSIGESTGRIRWDNVTFGNYSFVLIASTGPYSKPHYFNLSVGRESQPSPQGHGPAILSATGPNGTEVKSSEMITFSVNATDPDGDSLTYDWRENGVTLSTERSFSRKFPPGNHTLIVLIGDGRHTTSQTFNFTVAPPSKTVNTKPASIPGLGAGIAAATFIAAAAITLFWRRERR